MTLLAGEALTPSKFFQNDEGIARGSSVDLTIAEIIDTEGKTVGERFLLQPGHMILVVSRQVFKLPDTITGHVTYKTSLTRQGIWALTVGIVDPGWDGPIATNLLNFSDQPYLVEVGAAFLRVSFFQHAAVDNAHMKGCGGLPSYMSEARALAVSRFPATFMDQEKITAGATAAALKELRGQAGWWVAGISVLFTAIALLTQLVDRQFISRDFLVSSSTQVEELKDEVRDLRAQLRALEEARNPDEVTKQQQSGRR